MNSELLTSRMMIRIGDSIKLFANIKRALQRHSEEEFFNLDILNSLTNDVDIIDGFKWTALHYAATEGNHQITKILLKSGADINLTTNFGRTPLHLACFEGHANCIHTILDFKPEMNVQDSDLFTPLLLFLTHAPEDEVTLKALLDAGANTNCANKDGYTALHLMALAREGNKTKLFAQTLIDYNADVNYKNLYRVSALHLAINRMNSSLVRALLDNGACINSLYKGRLSSLDLAYTFRFSSPPTFEVVVEHLTMHYCCGFEVSRNDLDRVREMEIFKKFKEIWDHRLLQLKRTTIGQSRVSFHDILVSPASKIAKYLYNSDILNTLRNFDINDNVMGRHIKRNFEEGLKLHKAVLTGKNSCMKFMIVSELCIDRIIEFLDMDDLQNLSKIFTN